MITRRGLIGGLAAFIAAPAIIKVASVMPIKAAPVVMVDIPPLVVMSNPGVMTFWSNEHAACLWSDKLSEHIRNMVMPLRQFT